MIETRVRVLSSRDGVSLVEATEQNGCGACAARGACSLSGLGRYFSRRRRPIAVAGPTGVAGQELVVAVAEADLLRAGLWAYLLPALLAVGAAAFATAAGAADAVAVPLAGLGLAAGLYLARGLARAPRLHVRRAEHPLAEHSLTSGEAP